MAAYIQEEQLCTVCLRELFVLLSFTVFLAIDQAVPVPHLQRLSDNRPPLKMPMRGAACTTYKFTHLVHTLSPPTDTYIHCTHWRINTCSDVSMSYLIRHLCFLNTFDVWLIFEIRDYAHFVHLCITSPTQGETGNSIASERNMNTSMNPRREPCNAI